MGSTYSGSPIDLKVKSGSLNLTSSTHSIAQTWVHLLSSEMFNTQVKITRVLRVRKLVLFDHLGALVCLEELVAFFSVPH